MTRRPATLARSVVDSAAGCGGLARLLALDLGRHGGGERGRVHRVSAPARAAGCMHASNLSYIYERERNPWERPCPAGESCPASLRVAMRSPLPFPCVPYRPSLGPCGFPFSPASVEEPTAQIPCFAPLVGRGAPYGHQPPPQPHRQVRGADGIQRLLGRRPAPERPGLLQRNMRDVRRAPLLQSTWRSQSVLHARHYAHGSSGLQIFCGSGLHPAGRCGPSGSRDATYHETGTTLVSFS